MKKALWLSTIVIIALILSACGAAKPANPTTSSPGGETFMLALPRMVVEIGGGGDATPRDAARLRARGP